MCLSLGIIGISAQDLSIGYSSIGLLAQSLIDRWGSIVPVIFGLQPSCSCSSRVLAVVLSSVGVLVRLLLLSLACSRCVEFEFEFKFEFVLF